MQVRVKLFATLARAVSGARAGEAFVRSLPAGSTVGDLAASLGLPLSQVRLVFVDGLAKGLDEPLGDGAEVGLFPPIGGGG